MSKIVRICDLLDKTYGIQKWTHREPILDQLVLTILSQNTTAKNCNAAYNKLRSRFPDWDAVRIARVQDIANAIKVGGLANQKAPRIQTIMEQIYEQQGNLDLEWIADVPDNEAIEYLLNFNGVGRKTAACVLMFALNRPVMPVDTHIYRVSVRLGLIGEIGADRAHDVLQELVPPERIYSFHINMVTHGRQVCHAKGPECYRCSLRWECNYFAENAGT